LLFSSSKLAEYTGYALIKYFKNLLLKVCSSYYFYLCWRNILCF